MIEEKLIEYLKTAYQMELDLDVLRQIAQSIDEELKDVQTVKENKQTRLETPKENGDKSFLAFYKKGLTILEVYLVYLACLVLLYWVLKDGGLKQLLFGSFLQVLIVILIPLVVLYLIYLGTQSLNSEKQEQSKQPQKFTISKIETLSVEDEKLNHDLLVETYNLEKQKVVAALDHQQAALSKYYEAGMVKPVYQNLTALTMIIDYLTSSQAVSLDEAYELFDKQKTSEQTNVKMAELARNNQENANQMMEAIKKVGKYNDDNAKDIYQGLIRVLHCQETTSYYESLANLNNK